MFILKNFIAILFDLIVSNRKIQILTVISFLGFEMYSDLIIIEGLRGKRIKVNIPNMFRIAVLKFQNSIK